jgi:hypothetical protein|tara:strand:- start:1426 stop:2586 length:1161 start_codon:yes stop_codon:yes gene_type:complete
MGFPIIGLGLSALRFAAPYALRAGKALTNPTNIRNYLVGKPVFRSGIGGIERVKKFGIPMRRNIGALKFGPYGSNLAAQSGLMYGGKLGYDLLADSAEQSVEDNKIDDSQITETKGKKVGADRKQAAEGMLSEGIKNLAGETTDTPEGEKAKDIQDVFKLTNKQSNDIKDGKLDDYIKQNMSVFDKYLGDTKGRSKAAVYNAMVQFGLGLASARGGNLADKIARSAREPLAEFAKVGTALADRADKIKMAAVEQGLKQQQQEREFAQEKELAEMDATGGTDFQQNLATIQLMAPDLNSKDQIRLARGLKLGETREEYIRNNVINWMGVTGEDKAEAEQSLGSIYDGSTGSSVSYEDAFAATKEANPKATDEEINKFLADQGITPSS